MSTWNLKKIGLDDLAYKAEMKDTEKKGTDINGKRGGMNELGDQDWTYIYTIATMEK